LPALQKLGEKERQLGNKKAEVNQNLGFSQAFEYGEQSNLEYVSNDIQFWIFS
jgi:nucleoporin NUP82